MIEPSAWRKASYSGDQGACVEVGPAPAHVGIRDTKNREQGHLTVSRAAWRHFVQHVTR